MTATAVAAILALFWLAPWNRPLDLRWPGSSPAQDGPAPAASTTPTPTPGQASAPEASTTTIPRPEAQRLASQEPGRSPITPESGSGNPAVAISGQASPRPAGATPPRPEAAAPTFDIVRVEPNGDTVIAGRSQPQSDVTLLDGETVVAHAKSDASGQFALVPPSLSEGGHYLTLKVDRPGQAAVASAQGVAISVVKGGAAKPMVALLSPDQAAKILSDGSAAPGPRTTNASPAAAPAAAPVAIQAVEAGQGGRFLASGVAHPGNQCRVYLNGAYLADVTAGKDGRWSVEVQKGMKAGRYTVRADELEDGSGKVIHRAEVPFDYPVNVVEDKPGSARQMLMAKASPDHGAPADAKRDLDRSGTASIASVTTAPDTSGAAGPARDTAVVADLQTATVVRGDSLWRISRKMLGHGIRYTQIYATNVTQIRDPALIYPGQVFVVPAKAVN